MKIAVFSDVFPELSETFVANEVAAMQREGHEVRVVAVGRPRREHWPPGLEVEVTVLNDLPRSRKLAAGLRLGLTRPRACARDLAERSSWRPADAPRRLSGIAPVATRLAAWGVDHVHVHFAARAALEGLRVGALLGVPVSITAHAYDIFLTPRNLERKLRRAAFTTTGCRYNVAHLRELVGPPADSCVHEIVMGVDPEAFRRGAPHASAGRVLAIGRLVEKKGFDDLVRATALLRDDPAFAGVTIVGEGPEGEALRSLAASSDVADRVELAGALPPEQVRALLERAAVLAMPCIVARDGDRDSMPVVVKEALAMEVPVVATDEVGLPELVDDSCGRLVPPRDPAALAGALREVLTLSVEERAALGRAGRRRVIERCDVAAETRRLLALMEAQRGRSRPRTAGTPA